MHWHLGGNFAPVRMICQIDWRECPGAIANYIWCEVVTDVLDYLAKDGVEWRVPAILVVGFFLLRAIYKKTRSNTAIVPDKEIINQVGSKVQDLELKVNVLTYKLQYGTWPLPHQIHGTFVKRGSQNVRLSLSGPSSHSDWMRNLSLRRNRPCISHTMCNPHIASQLSHLIDWENEKVQPHMQRSVLPIKYSGAKHSNSSSERSCEYNSEQQRKNPVYLEGINKISKSEDLQVYHGKMNRFLPNPRRNNGRLSYKERISRDLSFYRRCYEFRAYERFTKTMEECKSFLRQLHTNNKNLGLVYSSSETVSSLTDTGVETQAQNHRGRRKEWNKNDQYPVQPLRNNCENIGDRNSAFGNIHNTATKTIMRTSSITNLTDQKLLISSMKPPTPTGLITSGCLMHAPITLTRNKLEQNSERTLLEVKRRLESLYNVLQNLDMQNSALGKMPYDKGNELYQDSTDTFEYIIGEIKYLSDKPFEESRVDVMTQLRAESENHSLSDTTVSCIYSTEPNKTEANKDTILSIEFKNDTNDNDKPEKEKVCIANQSDSILIDTEDDATVVSSNSSNSDTFEIFSDSAEQANCAQTISNNSGLGQNINSNMGNGQQLIYLDIIAEEQSTGSSSERASPKHLRMNKQDINNEKPNLPHDELVHFNLEEEKRYIKHETPILESSSNNLEMQYSNVTASDKKPDILVIETPEASSTSQENNESVSSDVQAKNSEELNLKRYPGVCSLVEQRLVLDGMPQVEQCPKQEVNSNAVDMYETINKNTLEISDVIGSSTNCMDVSRTNVETKYSVSKHENRTQHENGNLEFVEVQSSELEYLLSVNKWCLDQQEHNTIYNSEYNLNTNGNSLQESIYFREEESSINTTVSSVPDDTKYPDKSLAKKKVVAQTKVDSDRQKGSKVHTSNNKTKPTSSTNYDKTQVKTNEKAGVEIQSIGSNTTTNATDVTSLGVVNSSEDDLRPAVKGPTTFRVSKNNGSHQSKGPKHVKQSATTENVKRKSETVSRTAKSKVRSNLTCARVRCSSVEPEGNRDPSKPVQPKRSRSQCTERRTDIRHHQSPFENKMPPRSSSKTITSTPKLFSKSNIPVLKTRLEAARRTESETSPRSSKRECLPTSMSWKSSTHPKTSNIHRDAVEIEKDVQCMGEVKNTLPKNTEVVGYGNKDVKLKTEGENISPSKNCILEQHTQAAIYVKIFTQDYKNTTGIMNPNKFLEYIKGNYVNSQAMISESQPSTPRNRNRKVFSIVTNTQDCDAYKIIATTSTAKHNMLNDISALTTNDAPLANPTPSNDISNLYFLSIEQKDVNPTNETSLEINLSIQNLQQLSESSENALKKFQLCDAPKELNNDEYATLIEVLHKAQNHLYLQEVYDLCKRIISQHQNSS